MNEISEYSSNSLILCRKYDVERFTEIDKTFLTRLLSVLRHIRDCYGSSDQLIDDEIFYLINVVDNMRYFQKYTIGSKEEKDYFNNLNE